MRKKNHLSDLIALCVTLLCLHSATAIAGNYEFKKEVSEEYANEQPPGEECLIRLAESEAVTAHQERVDTFIEERCLAETGPTHFYCWIPALVERHCLVEADQRTRKSESMCKSQRDKITTVSYALTSNGEVIWSGENVFRSKDYYLDENVSAVILSQKEEMAVICENAKRRLIEL